MNARFSKFSFDIPIRALAAARLTRWGALQTVLELDREQLDCEQASDLYSGFAALVATWEGRLPVVPPPIEESPMYMEAAIKWRAERDRRKRR